MRPSLSIITAVFDPPVGILRATIASVVAQTCEDWEWCVVDDGSSDERVIELLEGAAARDPRIRFARRASNGGIVAASNDALAMAHGEWVAFLDHDDRLAPQAAAVLLDVAADSGADVIYSDEEIVSAAGHLRVRHLKPAWSPSRMRTQMYSGHLCAMRAELVRAIGGFRAGTDGSQDYDLMLRAAEQATLVAHVPKGLYRWVEAEASTANDPGAKPWAFEAGIRVVQEHCDRVGLAVEVEATDLPGVHRLRRRFAETPLVSVVIPTRGSRGRAWGEERCFAVEAVRSIVRQTTYPAYEIVIVADADAPRDVLDELEAVAGGRLRIVPFAEDFNFSRKCNLGAAQAAGDLLLFLNDDVEVVSPDWIEALLGPLQEDAVGMTGALLLFEGNLVQHAGQSVQGEAHHVLHRMSARLDGPMAALRVERECAGVTAACALLRRSDFDAVGGFSEDFAANYNDVDLSLKVRHDLGKRIVWTPYARLWHFESSTRDPTVTPDELRLIHDRWPHAFADDPYFTPAMGDFLVADPPLWR